MSPLKITTPILTPNNKTLLFQSTVPTVGSVRASSPQQQTSSLQRSLIGGLGLDPRSGSGSGNGCSRLLPSRQTSIDWADVRLTIHLYSERESLDALYRPLAVPRLLKTSFDGVVKKIRVLWNQLQYPMARRSSVTTKMSNMTKENYMLLVSHMLLLQAAHRHLISIVNKIRKDVGEDPVGVGVGSHVTPKRPAMPLQQAASFGGLMSPRRGLRTKKTQKKLAAGNPKKRNKGNSPRGRRREESSAAGSRGNLFKFSTLRRRNDQWQVELSTSISQLKGLTPWIQEFVYRGETYV